MGIVFIILACLCWALDTLVRYPLIYSGLESSKLVFAEHLLLCLIFSPFIIKLFKNKKFRSFKVVLHFVVIGGVGSALATLAFTRAFSLINPSLVILLQKLQPIVAIMLAKSILKEQIRLPFITWGALCLLGGALMSYDDLTQAFELVNSQKQLWHEGSLMGYILSLIAVIGWGASTVFGKYLVKEGMSDLDLLAGRFFFGLIFLFPVILTHNQPLITIGGVWSKVILMVLVSGALGMGLYYMGLRRMSARLCALAEMFFPFCAIALNWIFLDAKLAPIQIMGGLLLVVGSTVIQVKRY